MKMRAVFYFCLLISSSVMAARAPATYSDSASGTIDTRVCAAPLASATDFDSRTHTCADSNSGAISTMPVSVVLSFR